MISLLLPIPLDPGFYYSSVRKDQSRALKHQEANRGAKGITAWEHLPESPDEGKRLEENLLVGN